MNGGVWGGGRGWTRGNGEPESLKQVESARDNPPSLHPNFPSPPLSTGGPNAAVCGGCMCQAMDDTCGIERKGSLGAKQVFFLGLNLRKEVEATVFTLRTCDLV